MALCRRWHCIYNATVYLVGHPSFEVWGMSVFVCIYVLIHTFCCRHWANIDPVPHWWDCEYNVHYVHSPLSMYTSTCNETSTLRSWTNVLSLFFIQYGCPFVGYKTVKCLIIFFFVFVSTTKKAFVSVLGHEFVVVTNKSDDRCLLLVHREPFLYVCSVCVCVCAVSASLFCNLRSNLKSLLLGASLISFIHEHLSYTISYNVSHDP